MVGAPNGTTPDGAVAGATVPAPGARYGTYTLLTLAPFIFKSGIFIRLKYLYAVLLGRSQVAALITELCTPPPGSTNEPGTHPDSFVCRPYCDRSRINPPHKMPLLHESYTTAAPSGAYGSGPIIPIWISPAVYGPTNTTNKHISLIPLYAVPDSSGSFTLSTPTNRHIVDTSIHNQGFRQTVDQIIPTEAIVVDTPQLTLTHCDEFVGEFTFNSGSHLRVVRGYPGFTLDLTESHNSMGPVNLEWISDISSVNPTQFGYTVIDKGSDTLSYYSRLPEEMELRLPTMSSATGYVAPNYNSALSLKRRGGTINIGVNDYTVVLDTATGRCDSDVDTSHLKIKTTPFPVHKGALAEYGVTIEDGDTKYKVSPDYGLMDVPGVTVSFTQSNPKRWLVFTDMECHSNGNHVSFVPHANSSGKMQVIYDGSIYDSTMSPVLFAQSDVVIKQIHTGNYRADPIDDFSGGEVTAGYTLTCDYTGNGTPMLFLPPHYRDMELAGLEPVVPNTTIPTVQYGTLCLYKVVRPPGSEQTDMISAPIDVNLGPMFIPKLAKANELAKSDQQQIREALLNLDTIPLTVSTHTKIQTEDFCRLLASTARKAYLANQVGLAAHSKELAGQLRAAIASWLAAHGSTDIQLDPATRGHVLYAVAVSEDLSPGLYMTTPHPIRKLLTHDREPVNIHTVAHDSDGHSIAPVSASPNVAGAYRVPPVVNAAPNPQWVPIIPPSINTGVTSGSVPTVNPVGPTQIQPVPTVKRLPTGNPTMPTVVYRSTYPPSNTTVPPSYTPPAPPVSAPVPPPVPQVEPEVCHISSQDLFVGHSWSGQDDNLQWVEPVEIINAHYARAFLSDMLSRGADPLTPTPMEWTQLKTQALVRLLLEITASREYMPATVSTVTPYGRTVSNYHPRCHRYTMTDVAFLHSPAPTQLASDPTRKHAPTVLIDLLRTNGGSPDALWAQLIDSQFQPLNSTDIIPYESFANTVYWASYAGSAVQKYTPWSYIFIGPGMELTSANTATMTVAGTPPLELTIRSTPDYTDIEQISFPMQNQTCTLDLKQNGITPYIRGNGHLRSRADALNVYPNHLIQHAAAKLAVYALWTKRVPNLNILRQNYHVPLIDQLAKSGTASSYVPAINTATAQYFIE